MFLIAITTYFFIYSLTYTKESGEVTLEITSIKYCINVVTGKNPVISPYKDVS